MTMVSGSLVVLAFLVVFVLSHTSQNTEASSVGATESEDKEVHFRFPWEEIHNHNIKLVRQRKGKGLKVGTIPVPDRFQEEGLTPFQGFTPRRQFLVFTSCGDRSRIPLWAGTWLRAGCVGDGMGIGVCVSLLDI